MSCPFALRLPPSRGRFFLALGLLAALAGCDAMAPTGPSMVVFATGTPAPAPSQGPGGPSPSGESAIRPIAERHAASRGLPRGLVLAVIAQESAFNPLAVSSAGAQGLMQLMPGTVQHINEASDVKVLDPFDAEQNVAGGCWYLKWVRSQVPESQVAEGEGWKMALAGYNGGIGRVRSAITKALAGAPAHPKARWEDVSPHMPAETRAYVPAVIKRWAQYGD